jgi:hypothetical protein
MLIKRVSLVVGITVLLGAGASYMYNQLSYSSTSKNTLQSAQHNEMQSKEVNSPSQISVSDNVLIKSESPAQKEIQSSTKFNPPVSVSDSSLFSKFLGVNVASPSYINENHIFSEVDDSTIQNKQQSFILQINRKNQEEEKIYVAPNKRVINSLVGLDANLYWIEYERSRDKDQNLSWELFSMDLATKKVNKITAGVAQDQIDPPVLRVHNDIITWIEKKISDGIVYSTIFIVKEDQTPQKIKTVSLDEKDKNQRNGIFLDIQRPVSEGVLLQEVFFSPNKTTGTNDKKSRISLYPYSGGDSKIIMETNGYTDFTLSGDWFVLAKDGMVNIYSLSKGALVYSIKQEQPTTTTDSPFIHQDTLFYRTSMLSISAFNLQTGEHAVISNKGSVTTKIFNSSNKLGFSFIPAEDNTKGYIEFTVLEE